MPSEPWMCNASNVISRSTRAIVNFTAAIVGARLLGGGVVDLPRHLEHEQTQHAELRVRLGDLLLHHLVLADDLAVGLARERPLAHHVEGQLALGDGAHRVVDAAGRRDALGQHLGAVLGAEQVVEGHPDVAVDDVVVVPGLGHDLDAGVFRGTTYMPLVHITNKRSATRPAEVNHFSPLMTHSSPSRTAVVRNRFGSLPPCGSVIE